MNVSERVEWTHEMKNESVILNTAIQFYQDVPSSRPPIFFSFAASPALSRVAGWWEEEPTQARARTTAHTRKAPSTLNERLAPDGVPILDH